jgi:hypothetical protein
MLARAAICNSPNGCMVVGCQKNGDGLRGSVSPSPLIGFPEALSSCIVSGRGR